MHGVRRISLIAVCLLWALAVCAGPALPVDLSAKRLFLLYSYHPTFPTSAKILDGLRAGFGDNQPIIDIEYMDSKRLYDNQSRKLFLDTLTYKLAHRDNYDVIISADDNALDFLLAHRDRLFPGVPAVFLGVNDVSKAVQQNSNPSMTGIVEASSFRETLALIEQLLPKRTRLHVVVDSTTSGQADLHTLLRVSAQRATGPVDVLSLAELTWGDLAERVAALDNDDAVLLLSAYRDSAGHAKSFSEGLAVLRQHAEVPIFHLWEHGLGEGVLGGVLVDHREQGRQAAFMARQILSGESPADIPVMEHSPNTPIFDFRQLERFGIPIAALPERSVVRFRPTTLWYTHRHQIIAVLIAVAALIGLSFYLARENAWRARVTRELGEKTRFVQLLMNTIPDLVWMKDPDGVYLTCNRRFEKLYGAAEGDIVGKTDFDFVAADLARFFRDHDQLAMEKGSPNLNVERLTFASDGHQELLETIKTPVFDGTGRMLGVLGVARDITERRATEERVRVLSQAVEQSPVSVMVADANGNVEYVNRAFELASGYAQHEVLGTNIHFLQADGPSGNVHDAVWSTLNRGETWQGEIENRRKNGEVFWEYAHFAPVVSDNGSVSRYVVVKEDITLRKRQQQRIAHQAHFDSLTGLPNRVLALDRLDQLLMRAKRQQQETGILFIDLDDFKKVNDSLGHDVGDEVLVQAANRLRDEVRAIDTVGRLGGDEFIVLLGGLDHPRDASIVAHKLIEALKRPFVVENRELLLAASIGIALFPDDGELPKDLLRKADTAMYSAKRSGRGSCAYFTPELNAHVDRRFALEEQLHGALQRGEIGVVYQPQVELATGKLVGIEALLRWHSPVLGDVPPDEFVAVAEQTGAIIAIGRHVIETALNETREWCSDGNFDCTVAVNLSPRQFRDVGLEAFVVATLEATGFPGDRLEFEITEGVLMDRSDIVEQSLAQMNSLGIKLAMDDFGTGYSSLSYLRHYPFDTLKIDREFIRDITVDVADRELVSASISLAHALGLTVVAEGVETREQHALLLSSGCDIGQGYFYGRPESLPALRSLLPEGIDATRLSAPRRSDNGRH